MRKQRLLEVLVVFAPLCCWTLAGFFTISNDQKWEVLIWFGVLSPLVVLAYFVRPFLLASFLRHLFLVIIFFVTMFIKHLKLPYQAPIHSLLSFSFIFHMANVANLMAICELYHRRVQENKTYLILYSFLVLVGASYSTATWSLMIFLPIYGILVVFLNRVDLHQRCPEPVSSGRSQRAWLYVLALMLLLCSSLGWFLNVYRKEVNEWRPLSSLFGDQSSESGFSPISVLTSKNIELSREPVLRYFAPFGRYYLRGKVFDRYHQGRWELTSKNRFALERQREQNGRLYFSFPHEKLLVPGQWQRLLYLETEESILFAPLGTQAVSLKRGPVYSDSERNLWTSPHPDRDKVDVYLPSRPTRFRSFSSPLSPEDYQRYTQVPEGTKEFLQKLATKITRPQDSTIEKVMAVRSYLREHFRYGLETKLPKDQDPIRSFLETAEQGHCEMFASSFVMLARSLGIPARYVTGYYAHEWNNLGKFITIRACDAHAWAEVFLEKGGWTQIEPTPPASLEQLLWSYRGMGESYREWLAEWWRSHQKNWPKLFSSQIFSWQYLVLLVIIILATLWYYHRQHLVKQSSQQQPANHKEQQLPPEILQLSQQWQSHLAQTFRHRHPNETLREYQQQAALQLPPELNAWSKRFVTLLESMLYQEKTASPPTLASLSKQWQQVLKVSQDPSR